jgi:hypothetical protein
MAGMMIGHMFEHPAPAASAPAGRAIHAALAPGVVVKSKSHVKSLFSES